MSLSRLSIGEHRLLFQRPAAGAGAAAPTEHPMIEAATPEKAKEKLQALRLDSLEGQRAIQAFIDDNRVNAERDQARLQTRYREVVTAAAMAEFRHLTAPAPGPARSAVDALAQVRATFANFNVHFEVNGAGELQVQAHRVEAGARMAQERVRPDVQQAIREAFGDNPIVFEAVMRLAEGMERDEQWNQLRDLATEIKALGDVGQYVFTDGIRILSKTPPNINADVNALALTDAAKTSLRNFLNSMNAPAAAGKKEILLRLGAAFNTVVAAERERNNALTSRDIQAIIRQSGLDRFDASRASELDRRIMLAHLRSCGIDLGDEGKVNDAFAKPPKLQEFQGSPEKKAFYRLMGAVEWLILSFQKLKESLKPATSPATGPTGRPGEGGRPGPEGAPSAASAERRRNLVTEMKDAVPPMTGVQLKASKGDRLRVLNQAAGADSIQALQRRADSLRPSATAPTATEAQKNELRDLDTRIRDLTQERDRLQADVTELDAMKRETDTARAEMRIKRDNIIDLINALATRVPPKTIPGTEGLNAALGSFSFDGNDYFQLEATPGAAAPRWGHVDVINSVIHAKLGLGPDRAISVSDSGIFNSPLVARDAMAALYQKLDEESRAPAAPPAAPAAAPAGPAAPPPAEEGGPREF